MKKPINKCKDKSFVKIPGVSGYLINKKGEIFSEFKGEVMKPSLRSGYHFVVIMTDTGKLKKIAKKSISYGTTEFYNLYQGYKMPKFGIVYEKKRDNSNGDD